MRHVYRGVNTILLCEWLSLPSTQVQITHKHVLHTQASKYQTLMAQKYTHPEDQGSSQGYPQGTKQATKQEREKATNNPHFVRGNAKKEMSFHQGCEPQIGMTSKYTPIIIHQSYKNA